MDVGDWQKRLEETFSVDGIVGRRLQYILDAEVNYGVHIANTYHGHLFLINSFFDFYIETIKKTLEWVKKNGWPKMPYYSYTVLYYVNNFKSFRATDIMFMHGYPFEGYSLLRDLKDRAIYLSAVIHKITNFSLLSGEEGVQTVSQDTMEQIIKNRKKEEKKVHDLIIGKKSNLPPDIFDELVIWEKLFHEQVHGAKLTFTSTWFDWIKRGRPLHVEPIPTEDDIAMYVNRASEIGWLILRTFPFLQLEVNAFGKDWKAKYIILDESFEIMIRGLEKMGKKIATAFIYFIKNKFVYPDNLHYSE